MKIDQSDFEGILVLDLSGRLNAAAAADLDAVLTSALAAGPRDGLICMERVVYMGHSGLRVLLTHARAIRAAGRKLVLACVPELVFDVLEQNGLNQEFDFSAGHKDGFALLRGPGAADTAVA